MSKLGGPKAPKRDHYNTQWDIAKKSGIQYHIVTVRIAKSSMLLGALLNLRVQVMSTKMQGRGKHVEQEIHRGDTMSSMREKAVLMAGAMAELCCESYGDNYDPSEIAKAGGDAFDQITQKLMDGEFTAGRVQG
jgi:hypothetical protein